MSERPTLTLGLRKASKVKTNMRDLILKCWNSKPEDKRILEVCIRLYSDFLDYLIIFFLSFRYTISSVITIIIPAITALPIIPS